MKKLVLVAVAIVAMTFVSCNNMCSNKNAEQNDSIMGAADTTLVVDSAAVDSVVETPAE
jgi:uncharacterized lipoprotein NlpE involved in copper resistance